MTGTRASIASAALLIGAPALAFAQITTTAPTEADVNLALGLDSSEIISVEFGGAPGLPSTAWVEIDGAERLMVLQPHDARSEKYQVVEHLGGDDYRVVEPSTAVTFRGEILDMPGIQVAASWLDDGLHARLFHEDGHSDWIEPLAGRVPGAAIGSYAFYSDDDVSGLRGTCGVTDAHRSGTPLATPEQIGGEVAFGSTLKIAELGVDTDFEYFSDYGTVAATENRINSIIDTMNLQYENEVAITHQITTIIVRSSSNDPYSSFDAGNFLGQFRSHWINNQQSVQRDVAHLFTGKNLNGGTIGVAYLGAICSTNIGYGLVESDCCGSFATKTDLSAHELGHNWNADHCSCSSPNYTMNPFLTAANRFSPTQTIPAMINYAANRPCLDDGSTGGPDPVIDNISPFFVTAVDPNAPVQVVVNGSGFNGADEVAIDGVPLSSFPPQFQIVDDGEIRITLLPPQDVGVKVISVTEGSVTATANLSVVFNANPTIDLVNSDPDFLLSFVPIEVHMGAVQGDIHFLLASTENIPTSVPGVFDVAIGNNLSSLFLLGDFAIGSTGNRTFSTPLVGLGSGTKLYFQSVVFDASNPVLPLAASNVESGTILF